MYSFFFLLWDDGPERISLRFETLPVSSVYFVPALSYLIMKFQNVEIVGLEESIGSIGFGTGHGHGHGRRGPRKKKEMENGEGPLSPSLSGLLAKCPSGIIHHSQIKDGLTCVWCL